MRRRTSALGLLALLACEPEFIDKPREDAGGLRDAGNDGPLFFQPGMVFVYEGFLTYRSAAVGVEEQSRYQLTVTIQSADDQGAQGESTLVFTATGMQTFDQNWQPTSDFDLWTARLGPALATDVVGTDPVTERLDQPPAIPPPPMPPKRLPVPGTFFLDVRRMDLIRNAFAEAHQGERPLTVDPSMTGNMTWQLSYEREEPILGFYPPNSTRKIDLFYHQNGYLTELTETLGDLQIRPAATCRLRLVSGP